MVVLLVALAACQSSDRATYVTPQLVALDSVQLAETDSLFLGQASGLVAARDGNYLIADQRTATIHRYAPDGAHLGTISRKGTGPGEIADGLTAIALDGDSLLFVLDGLAALHTFDYPAATFRVTRKIPLTFSHSISAHAGKVIFRNINKTTRTSVGIIDVVADATTFGGAFPPGLGDSPVIDQLAFGVAAPLGGDTIAQVMVPWDRVFVGPARGQVFDTIPVAVLHRQGSRPDLLAKIAQDPRNAGPEVYTPSMPMVLARLSNGHFAFVAADLQLVQTRFTGKLHLSVVDPATRRTCPDAEIPAPTDPRSWAAFRGDTLIVLSQQVGDAGASAWIRKYRVDSARCAWIEGAGKPGSP